jgi:predicted metal-dependent hydrolase
MTHLVLQERQKTVIHPFQNLLNGGQSQTVRLGTGRRLVFTLSPSARTGAKKTCRGWTVTVSPQIRRKALHRFLWSLLAKQEHARIEELVHAINKESFGVRVTGVRLSFASTQWGSCSPKGVIMLNAALLFLPPSLLRYVIAHELAHRIHPNHSTAYWREVERALPNYRQAYERLQQYRLPQL